MPVSLQPTAPGEIEPHIRLVEPLSELIERRPPVIAKQAGEPWGFTLAGQKFTAVPKDFYTLAIGNNREAVMYALGTGATGARQGAKFSFDVVLEGQGDDLADYSYTEERSENSSTLDTIYMGGLLLHGLNNPALAYVELPLLRDVTPPGGKGNQYTDKGDILHFVDIMKARRLVDISDIGHISEDEFSRGAIAKAAFEHLQCVEGPLMPDAKADLTNLFAPNLPSLGQGAVIGGGAEEAELRRLNGLSPLTELKTNQPDMY